MKRRRGVRAVVTALLATGVAGNLIMDASDNASGLAGARLLQSAGGVPAFQVAGSPEGIRSQQDAVRSRLRECLGDLPPRPSPAAVVVRSREDRGDWIEERFDLDNGAGSRVPGLLLLPKGRPGKAPGILYCHWHGGQYDGGKAEIFERKHTPAEPGPELARRGYAVLAVDAPCFGERQGRGPDAERGSAGELSAAKLELWLGRSLWGMLLRDDLIALDYLCSRPEVDASRIGATGISMGATRTWWLMALDERIRSGVAVACLTRYQDLVAAGGLRHHGIYYYAPGLLKHFDTEAVIAAIAPRSLLCLNGDQDAGSPAEGIRTIERLAAPAWTGLGAAAEFRSILYPGVGHEYTPAMWNEMLTWIGRTLGP